MRQNFQFFRSTRGCVYGFARGSSSCYVRSGCDRTVYSVKKSDSEAVSVRKQNRKALRRYAGLFSGKHIRKNTEGETSVHDAVPVMYLLHPEIFKGSQKILTVDCSEGSARGAVLGGFRWWQHEAEDANAFVLTEADKDRFREILITSLYELGQR